MSSPQKKTRIQIPTDSTRSLLVECGFKCSVPQCLNQWPSLQFHHIDENPSNNNCDNILMLCPNHHQMVTSKHIDRKICQMLKELLGNFNQPTLSHQQQTRNNVLSSLVAELFANLILFKDRSFYDFEGNQVYPRLRHYVLDQILASGAFIFNQDRELFTLLYDFSVAVDDINRRLDISEFRDIPRISLDEISNLRKTVPASPGFQGTYNLCVRVIEFLLHNYSSETDITYNTILFGVSLESLLARPTKNLA